MGSVTIAERRAALNRLYMRRKLSTRRFAQEVARLYAGAASADVDALVGDDEHVAVPSAGEMPLLRYSDILDAIAYGASSTEAALILGLSIEETNRRTEEALEALGVADGPRNARRRRAACQWHLIQQGDHSAGILRALESLRRSPVRPLWVEGWRENQAERKRKIDDEGRRAIHQAYYRDGPVPPRGRVAELAKEYGVAHTTIRGIIKEIERKETGGGTGTADRAGGATTA